jgi:hypothetical protein
MACVFPEFSMLVPAARVLFAWMVFLACSMGWAGQFRLQVGQVNRVPVGIEVRNAQTLCNVEISIEGGPTLQQRVSAPDFLAWLTLVPAQAGPVKVSWRGVFYRNEKDELFNACPTMGQTRMMATSGNADVLADWQGHWHAMGSAMAQCVQTALGLQGLTTAWYDRRDAVGSVMDKVLARSEQGCERFVQIKTPWGPEPMAQHACLWGGNKTRCEGYYLAPGKGPRLNYEQALSQHLAGVKLTAHHDESRAAQQARVRAAQRAQEKAHAEEEARVEAFKQALAEQKKREQAQEEAKRIEAEAERQRQIKAAEQREREWLENRPWLVRKLSRIQPKPLEEDPAKGEIQKN